MGDRTGRRDFDGYRARNDRRPMQQQHTLPPKVQVMSSCRATSSCGGGETSLDQIVRLVEE